MPQNTTAPTVLKYYDSIYSPEESLVLTVSISVIITASLIGSVIMLIVLYKNNKMWNSSNMLIGNLAAASLGATVTVMPLSLYTAAKQKWVFREGRMCKFTGSCGSLFLLATIFTHTMISVDKYFGVVRPMSRVMTVRKTCLFICGIWTLALMMSAGPLLGISGFVYNPTTLICGVKYPENNRDKLYLVILALLGFILPNIIMGYVYTRVNLAIKQHAVRLLAHAVISFDVLKLQKKLVLTVFSSLLCFLLCWSPFCALTIAANVTSNRDQIPRGLGVAAYWTGYLNSALNPIIICSMSNRFKQGFMEIFKSFVMLLVCGCLRTRDDTKATRRYTTTTDVFTVTNWFSKKDNFTNTTSQRCTTLPYNSRSEHSAVYSKRSNSLPSKLGHGGHGEVVKNSYIQICMQPISENNSETGSTNQGTPIMSHEPFTYSTLVTSNKTHESSIHDAPIASDNSKTGSPMEHISFTHGASSASNNSDTDSKYKRSCNGYPHSAGFSEKATDDRTPKDLRLLLFRENFKPELISIQTDEICV